MNIRHISKYISVTLSILFSISLIYTWNNWTDFEKEFQNFSIFEVAMILLSKAIINIFTSIIIIPFAIVKQLIIGAVYCTTIIIDEVLDALQILQKIFENWFVRWVWDKIIIVMNTIGKFLEPLFTHFVRLSIYLFIVSGISALIGFIVYFVYFAFSRLF